MLSILKCTFFIFLEKLIKSACLNTAQNLITDINTQCEHFESLIKRLLEIKVENSNESMSYGIFNTIQYYIYFYFIFLFFQIT